MVEQQRLHLLGPVRIAPIYDTQNETEEKSPSRNISWDSPRFRSRRGIALLGYLAVERRPISRSLLAALLWPDESLSKGRGSLRRELYNITQIVPGCWQMDHQAVAFVPSAEIDIDTYTVLKLEAQENWMEAADLLGGEFLEGLSLDNNSRFEAWLVGERDRWRWRSEMILTRVIEGAILRGRYREALQYCQRLLQFVPWKEETHRQMMRLFSWTGQRGAALHQFETCQQTLKAELDVEPSEETVELFQQIRAGELDLPPQLPAFLTPEAARREIRPPFVVARERELCQLKTVFEKALTGQSSVIFVIGGPGRGKTVLMDAFARQAMAEHANLLVASGNCTAYSGIGDPYLPFREIMAMLTGDVELKWDTGAITREHASRLWEAFPVTAKAFVEHAPNAVEVFAQGSELIERAAIFELSSSSPWAAQLIHLINHHQTRLEDFQLSDLFQQITNMLKAIADQKPLLLILDDVQWADNASLSLLFHLGRRLSELNSKILILCALRPEEVYSGHGGERHPLVKLLNELKRTFGDEWVELGQKEAGEARRFVDAILDSEPNRLGERFRSSLLQRTEGHPLFTVELLRAMQERGELFKDENGSWVAAADLDWTLLPSKVEAVIKERIERLDPKLQSILTIASVEGEVFTAEVVAEVQGVEVRSLFRKLSISLEGQHRLIKEQEGYELKGRYFSRFKFSHILYQNYLYQRLCEGERRLHHTSVANAIEKLYGNQLDSMLVPLAHHLHHAGDYERAYEYYLQAAERAARFYANGEAIAHYSQAVALIGEVSPDANSKANLYRDRGCIYEMIGKFDLARKDLEMALAYVGKVEDSLVKWRVLIDLGKLWAARDYSSTKKYFETALDLARKLNQPGVLAKSLNWIGNWYTNADQPQIAFQYHQEALTIVETDYEHQELANTLDLLGVSNLMSGNLKGCVQNYDKAIPLFRELDNRPRLVSSLTGRATTFSILAFLASVPSVSLSSPISDLKEALQIAGEIRSFSGEAWAYWSLGVLHIIQGQFGEAMNALQCGLEAATEIKHKEFIGALLFGLGLIYIELFDPDKAVEYLKKSLVLLEELDSRTMIHLSYGTLAGAYIDQGKIELAENYLDDLISTYTSMDSLGKRYCWVRRVEIALANGNLKLALDILDRLIATAPGLNPGDVITYLWMLKGEALKQSGHIEDAITLYEAAAANANMIGEKFLLWRAHAALGQLYLSVGRAQAAEKEFLESGKIVEKIAGSIADESIKEKFNRGAENTLASKS